MVGKAGANWKNHALTKQLIKAAQAGSIKSRDECALLNMGLVHMEALKINKGQGLEDLLQEGYLILIKCIGLFDLGSGFTFSTYACRALRNGLRKLNRRDQVVPAPSYAKTPVMLGEWFFDDAYIHEAKSVETDFTALFDHDNRSSTAGVTYEGTRIRKWIAKITRNKKLRYLGAFATEAEAIEARLRAEKEWQETRTITK